MEPVDPLLCSQESGNVQFTLFIICTATPSSQIILLEIFDLIYFVSVDHCA
jgi:hypothetical protein